MFAEIPTPDFRKHRHQRIAKVREAHKSLRDFWGKAVVVATHKVNIVEATAQIAEMSSDRVIGYNPEDIGGEEPKSTEPTAPTVWKLLQLVKYLKSLQRTIMFDSVLTSVNREWATRHVRSILALQHMVAMMMHTVAEQEAQRFLEQYTILASDIVLLIDDQPAHREARNNEDLLKMVDNQGEMAGLERRLKERHQVDRQLGWYFAYGMWDQNTIRICEFIIETTMPALDHERADLIRQYMSPDVSGGLKAVELLAKFPDQVFIVRDVANQEQCVIPRELAERIIVNKTLPTEALIDFITHEGYAKTLTGEQIGLPQTETVEYQLIPVAIATLGV